MTIAHTRYGHGPIKVLALPGLPGDHSQYDGVLPGIDAEVFEYVFAEYRGTGLSRELTGEYSLAEVVADLEAMIAQLGWQRLHVVGHSFGGFVAQRLALLSGDRVASLVAIAPVPASGLPLDAAGQAMLQQAFQNEAILLELAGAFAAGRLSATWVRWLVVYTQRICRPDAATAYFREFTDAAFAPAMSGLTTRCLILIGEHDPVYTRPLMEETLLRWLPHASLEVLPACGHFPMLEVPLLFATALERFFLGLKTEKERAA